jgi:ribonuclease R
VVLEQNSLKPEKGIWYHARILSDIHPEQYNCTLEKAVDMQKDLDVLDLVQRYSLPQDFPADCIAESGKEPPDNWQRIDLSDLRSYTIDGADAKDFDDAISLKKTADGFTLWVHITDVSHYVVPGSALDKEAFRRGTSVYFPKEVIPMLPEKLSNELCSLKPGEPRKTVSCEMHFNPQGKMQKAFVYPSILKSHKRFTYDEVQDILDGKLPGPFAEELQQCLELSKLLSSHKYHDGAIDFEFPEIKITLADDATVEKLELEPRLDAHRIVEEFMLAANEAVACFCAEINLGTIFRHQPPPGEQDINELDGILKTVKLSIPAGRERFKPKTYQKLVNSLTPDIKDFIQPLVLRSMRQAVYSEKHCTHFGLAKDYYCHFTSPIRRYPDLVVHRQLLNCLAENGLKFPYCIYPLQKEHRELKKPPLQNAREQAVFSSMTERRAVEVEREYQHRKKALFAETRLGQTFSARITGMLASGMFLEIADFPVEGFLPFESLSDYWDFNEKMMYAEKRRRNAKNNEESPVKTNVLRLGDMLSVTIHSIDREKYRVNLRAAG